MRADSRSEVQRVSAFKADVEFFFSVSRAMVCLVSSFSRAVSSVERVSKSPLRETYAVLRVSCSADLVSNDCWASNRCS